VIDNIPGDCRRARPAENANVTSLQKVWKRIRRLFLAEGGGLRKSAVAFLSIPPPLRTIALEPFTPPTAAVAIWRSSSLALLFGSWLYLPP